MKKSHKVFFIILVCIGVSGILLFSIGMAGYSNANQRYSDMRESYRGQIRNVATSILFSSKSKETEDAIQSFVSRLPGGSPRLNNFVLIDANGTILYKYSDEYLRAGATTLDLYWMSYMAMLDYGAEDRTWFYLFSDDSFGFSDPNDTGEELRHVGPSSQTAGDNNASAATLLKQMVDHEMPSQYVTIIPAADHSRYLLWLYDGQTSSIVMSGMQPGETLWGPYVYTAGFLVFVLYWLLAPVWVFLDARHRKSQPLPWALLVLVTNVVGMVVYWIVQSQGEKAAAAPSAPIYPACPTCGKPVQPEYPFCPWCSAPLKKTCIACGKTLEEDWVACPWCGSGCRKEE